MADKNFNVRIKQRRDTEANFEAVKNTFIPLNGEIVIVETSTGDRFKIGDGSSSYASLKFQDAHVMDLINDLVTGVSSVNGQTGAVTLDASSVGALASNGKAASAVTSDSCTGNSATATKATNDSAGQKIDTTYIKDLSINGKVITFTKGDGTSDTITTQDTNTTYSVMTAATASAAGNSGLTPQVPAGSQNKFLRGDGTWQEVAAGGGNKVFYGSSQPTGAVQQGDLWMKVL